MREFKHDHGRGGGVACESEGGPERERLIDRVMACI